jgi:hypothetical protein
MVAFLLLTACGDGAVAPAPTTAAPVVGAPATPASYVGRWAATPALCADGAWVFEERALNTAGETSCRFDQITSTASGYLIDAQCTAEAPARPYKLTLTLTDPAPPQSMTAAGGPWDGAVTLMRCAG